MSKALKVALVEMDRRFPNSKLEAGTAAAYYDDLTDLPEDAVIAAIVACRKSSRFMPTVSEIREMAVEIMGEEYGYWVTPEQAWIEMQEKARLFGVQGWRDVFGQRDGETVHLGREELWWSSPVVERAVNAIGWKELCTADLEKERTGLYAQFRDAIKTEQGRVKRAIVTGRAQATGALTLPEGHVEPKAIGEVLTGMLNALKEGHDGQDTRGERGD